MSKVLLKKIQKQYPNGFKAIDSIDLEIKDGEFMVFVGPSGCAKSTTLRMIAGLEEITDGEIWIGNKLVNDLPPKDRGIAMVFQNYALYPHMTVYENMAFGLKMAKIPKDEIDKRVKEAAEKLEITQLLDRKPKEMSGGQRQRVAVGRAIVRKPDVFLFDEPLSNLDAKLRVSMRVKISQLHKQLKEEGQAATMIYVTHDQVEAMTMGDRICVLNSGQIMQVDTPINLYNNPANKFVAGFIGSPAMNFIEGKILKRGENLYFSFKGNDLFISSVKKYKYLEKYIDRDIIMGIRPENIGNSLSLKKEEQYEENFIKGKITLVENMGNEEFLHFSISNMELISRVEVSKSLLLKYGEESKFYFDMEKCHFFDKITEKNIEK